MLSFVQRFHAVHQSDIDVASAHAVQSLESVSHPSSHHLASSITDLTAAVAALMADQRELHTSLASPPALQEPHWHLSCASAHSDVHGQGKPANFPTRASTAGTRRHCFNCNMLGHFARDCPWDTQCSLCLDGVTLSPSAQIVATFQDTTQ